MLVFGVTFKFISCVLLRVSLYVFTDQSTPKGTLLSPLSGSKRSGSKHGSVVADLVHNALATAFDNPSPQEEDEAVPVLTLPGHVADV